MIGVTSFSKKGYETYGKRFIETCDKFPGKIYVYTESPLDLSNDQVEERDFFEIPGVMQFLENIENVPKAKGKTEFGYNYNFDLYKFCRKMFCQFDTFDEGGKVIWLDADLEFKKPIKEKFLVEQFNKQALFYLGREGFYTETGIVGFDPDHKDFDRFAARYINTLRQGIVFTLKQWHDCACFDWAKEDLGNNLTPSWMVGDSLKVLNKTFLSKYMDHRKGNRKREILN